MKVNKSSKGYKIGNIIGIAIGHLLKPIKIMLCKHSYNPPWETTTILTNGGLAAMKMYECNKCPHVKWVITPR